MVETQADATNGSAKDAKVETKIPAWLVPEIFEDHLREHVKGYKNIANFKAYPAMTAGENYATIMLRIEIEINLDDGKTKSLSYMMKTPHDIPIFKELMKETNIFHIEEGVYADIVPEMEKMYRDGGVEVKFGAEFYKLKTDSSIDYILLEDLRPRGFKNINRLEGMDMDHTKAVLTKLSKWHAASATRVATKGLYPDRYTHGFFNDEMLAGLKEMWKGFEEHFNKMLHTYAGNEEYGEAALKLQTGIIDRLHQSTKIDPNEFNVLNHGDCWANNIMFQYDAFGKIKETYLVDFQIPKYGSPAQDLFYFLMSSTKLELKIQQFDYFIKFYHDQLIENLRLLKYPKKLPTLKDIHIMLYKYGIWGFNTATGVMAIVLLDPSESASISNFINDEAEGNDFKMLMYSNPRYRKHIEVILPWLYNRGVMEV